MQLSSLTLIGFETTAILDGCPDFDLSFQQVHEAAQRRKLVPLLQERFGEDADLSLLVMNPRELADTEQALSLAAEVLQGRESRKTGVANSGLCLVLAIVFEALQQQFHRP